MSAYYPMPEQRETVSGEALHKVFGSGAFMMAAVVFTGSTILSLLSLFFPSFSAEALLNSLSALVPLDELGVSSYELYAVLDQLAPLTKATSFLSLIPVLLTCLALWLIYTASRKITLVKKTAGFTILQVFVVLDLIGVILAAILVLVAMVPALSGIKLLDSNFELNGMATGVAIVLFAVILVVLILAIIYDVKMIGLYGGAKKLARNERLTKKASLFVIIFLALGLLGNLFNTFSSLLTALNTPFSSIYNYVTPLNTLLSFLYSLFMLICFCKLRRQEDQILTSYELEAQQAAMTGSFQSFPTPASDQPAPQAFVPYQAPAQQNVNAYQAPVQQTASAYQAPVQQTANAYQAPVQQTAAAYQAPAQSMSAYQQPYRSPYQPNSMNDFPFPGIQTGDAAPQSFQTSQTTASFTPAPFTQETAGAVGVDTLTETPAFTTDTAAVSEAAEGTPTEVSED